MKLLNILKRYKNHILKTKFLILLGFIASYNILKSPEYYNHYIRNKVDKNLVEITNYKLRGGGTGFHVQLPSGKVAILTNGHVCDMAIDKVLLVKSTTSNRYLPKKVIEDYPYSDLCLVEPLENVKGLKVAKDFKFGNLYSIVGHPHLLPTTRTSGEYISKQKIEVLLSIDDYKCDQPKHRKVKINFLFFELDACILYIDSIATTIPILPGSSGSPVVDFWGDVVGVAFAAESGVNWAFTIPLKDVVNFLRYY